MKFNTIVKKANRCLIIILLIIAALVPLTILIGTIMENIKRMIH
jgi:hypothetical protein